MLPQDIDKKILEIQESTRTSLPIFIPVHNVLRMRFNWYYRWHLRRASNFVHFALLSLFAVGMFAAVYNQAVPKSLATNENDGFVRINTEAGWNAGTKTNIDSASVPDSIKIDQAVAGQYDLISAYSNGSATITTSHDAGTKGKPVDGSTTSGYWGMSGSGHPYWILDIGESVENASKIWLKTDSAVSAQLTISNSPITCSNAYHGCSGTRLSDLPPTEGEVSFTPQAVRYISVQYVDDNALVEIKLYRSASATHISSATQLNNQNENASWSTFNISASVPAQTSLDLRFRTSTNAETWGTWTEYVDYAASINIGTLLGDTAKKKKYLQVESLLVSVDGSANPTISSYTANFTAVCPSGTTQTENNIILNTTEKWDAGTNSNTLTENNILQIDNKGGKLDLQAIYNSDNSTLSTIMDWAVETGNKASPLDGNINSFWGFSGPSPESTGNDDGNNFANAYWLMDLKQPYDLSQMRMYMNNDPDSSTYYSFQFSTSNDGINYSSVINASETEHKQWYSYNFSSQARYIKLHIDPSGWTAFRNLAEIELYGNAVATHISSSTQLDGTENISSWTTFVPSGSIPASTSIKFRFRTSADSSTWGSWTALTSYAASIDIGTLLGNTDKAKRYLQVETTLANTDGTSTPTLNNYTANYIACTPIAPEPSCTDGIQNQGETGIDCGGPCGACAPEEPDPTCSDGAQNGSETGIDCGGSCGACIPDDPDPTCSDGVQNGSETGVDCGGSCGQCEEPKLCQNGELQQCLASVDTTYQNCLKDANGDPAQTQACYSIPCTGANQCYLSCGMTGADQADAVHVVSPNGGEEYAAGGKVELKWSYSANPIIKQTMAKNNYAVKFSLSTDSGSSYNEVKTLLPKGRQVSWTPNGTPIDYYLTKDKNGNTSTAGPELADGYLSYTWEIPSDASLISDQVRVKLEPFASCSPVTEDASDGDFKIYQDASVISLVLSVDPLSSKIKIDEESKFTVTAKLSTGQDVTEATTFGFKSLQGGEITSQDGNSITVKAGKEKGLFNNAIAITGTYQDKIAQTTAGLEVYTDIVVDDKDDECVGLCIKEKIEDFITGVKGSDAVSAISLAVAAFLALGIGLLNIAGNVASAMSGSNIFSFFVKGVSKKEARGTVYDAITGLSIPYATVILTDLMTNQASFAISDKDGLFSISVSPGQKYEAKAEKLKYDLFKGYNSTKVKRFELKYSHNYFGGALEIPKDTYLFDYNIPMIPTETDSTAKKVNLFATIGKALTVLNYAIILVGLAFAFYATYFSPSLYNWIIFTLYIALIMFLIVKYLFLNGHNYGVVVDTNGKPVDLALVRAVRVKTGKLVKTIATDKNGKFGMALPVGVYHVYANKAGMQQTNEIDAIIGSAFKPARVKVKMDKYSNDTIKSDSQTEIITDQQKNAAGDMSSGANSSTNSADEMIATKR